MGSGHETGANIMENNHDLFLEYSLLSVSFLGNITAIRKFGCSQIAVLLADCFHILALSPNCPSLLLVLFQC